MSLKQTIEEVLAKKEKKEKNGFKRHIKMNIVSICTLDDTTREQRETARVRSNAIHVCRIFAIIN